MKNNRNYCDICTDPNAILENGECSCPPGEQLAANGICSTCKVPGCLICQPNEPFKCSQCLSNTSIYLSNSKCLCKTNYDKPSSIGYCSSCVAPNCISCEFGSSSTCYQCADENAYIENGICKCPSNKDFDNNGICQDVPDGCLETVSGDISKCKICHPGFQLNDQKQCQCEGALTINNDNYCSVCNVPGCKKCYSEQPNACAECLPAFNLLNNLCTCLVNTEFPN